MGLDNGWLVKSTERHLTREDLPPTIHYPFENDYNDDGIEIAYARKWWGLRTDLLNNIHWDETTEYEYRINTPEHLLEVIKIVISWKNKKRWNSDSNSFWTYKQVKYTLMDWIFNLTLIYEYMQKNPDIYLVFYDSY